MGDGDRPDMTLRTLVSEHIRHIERFGYSTVVVAANDLEPGWAYTVGLERSCGTSELLTIGLPPVKSQILLDHLARRCLLGDVPSAATVSIGAPISPLRLLAVGDIWRSASDYFNLGRIIIDEGWGSQSWPETQQVVWADRYGRFPEELPEGTPGRFLQPRLIDSAPARHPS